MRLRAVLFGLAAFGAAGWGAYRLAEPAALRLEAQAARDAGGALEAAGVGWAQVRADGLGVVLTGAAPDEAARLQAAEALRQVLGPGRLVDETRLAARPAAAAPAFALALLRNGAEISLIGLAPEAAGRGTIARALGAVGLDADLRDMIQSVAHPAPSGWEAALDFGLEALRALPQAKVSVTPGRVTVAALAPDAAAQREIEARLRDALPDDLVLDLEITAPRPVIAPYVAEFVMLGGTPRLAACTVETEAQAERIRAAAGLAGARCRLGLGVPSPDWTEAVVAGIEAVEALGAGRFALIDLAAKLAPAPGADREAVEAAAAALGERLPSGMVLAVAWPPVQAEAEARPAEADGPPPPARFEAVRLASGRLVLAGSVRDEITRAAVGSVATALFGHDMVENAVRVRADLPEGWPSRVLTGLEALSELKQGRLAVDEAAVEITGWAEESDGAAAVRALFAKAGLDEARVEVRFDAAAAARAAAAEARARDPVGACAADVAAITAGQPVAFEPGAAVLDEGGLAAVEAIGTALADCPPLDIEIAGHTDSQGGEESNQRLSEARAEAVRLALEARGLAQMHIVSRGFGADRPVADNATEEGRAQNRRIEFTLRAAGEGAQAGAAEAAEAGEAEAGSAEAGAAEAGSAEAGAGDAAR